MIVNRDKHKAVAVVALVAAVLVVAVSCVKEDVVSQNVWAFGVPLGGLRVQEAVSLIEEKINQIHQGPLVFKAGNISYEVSTDDLEVVLDPGQIKSRLEVYMTQVCILASHPFQERAQDGCGRYSCNCIACLKRSGAENRR